MGFRDWKREIVALIFVPSYSEFSNSMKLNIPYIYIKGTRHVNSSVEFSAKRPSNYSLSFSNRHPNSGNSISPTGCTTRFLFLKIPNLFRSFELDPSCGKLLASSRFVTVRETQIAITIRSGRNL